MYYERFSSLEEFQTAALQLERLDRDRVVKIYNRIDDLILNVITSHYYKHDYISYLDENHYKETLYKVALRDLDELLHDFHDERRLNSEEMRIFHSYFYYHFNKSFEVQCKYCDHDFRRQS